MQEKFKKTNNKFISHNFNETLEFAYDLAKNIKQGDIYCLIGELGVGKTVIAKGIGNFFNVNENITSPTFTIIKSYNTNNKDIKKINHFDLYRIKSEEELLNIGFEEYLFEENSISIIEWPEVAFDLLPQNVKIIKILKNLNNENIREIYY